MADLQAAFQRYLVGLPNEAGEIRGFCPDHENPDTSATPSASYNFPDGVWHCMACSSGGSIEGQYKKMRAQRKTTGTARAVRPADKDSDGDTHDLARKKTPTTAVQELPTEEQVLGWHNRLLKQTRLLAVMTEERGLQEETLREFLIGHDGSRYTIPIYDINGDLVNVRRYDPHARKAQDKMFSIGGHGQARIYRPDLLERYNEVIISEGEMDMMVGWQLGFPTVTHTAGAGTFMNAWGPQFAGKTVFICYDADDTGAKGAIKAAKVIQQHADAVYIMRLPLDIKGGDITDFFIKQGFSPEEFREVMQEARSRPFAARKVTGEVPTTGKPVTLEESQNPQHGDEAVEMVVQIAGKQTPPFVVPRKFRATCDQDKGNVCAVCPMSAWNGEHVVELAQNDMAVLELIDVNDKQKMGTLRAFIGARCSDHITYTVEESWSVEELLIGQSIDHRNASDEGAPLTRRVLNVGSYRTPINTTARIVGRQNPDPKNQRGLFLAWHLEQTQTSLDKFEMTPEMYSALRVFQPEQEQRPLDKLKGIANDLAANITQIYGRPELHIAYDMVYHSVLSFDFLGKRIEKGWLEMLVMGDTRTGKSEAATQLARHYNAGVIKSCEGMTFAGLVGGVQQLGGASKWMVTWGFIPLNDRRLVILDEVSGLKDRDVIENMSAIRSSGRAQLTKIATEETSARTRMIWISNPPDGSRLVESAGSAMAAIQKLVPNPEDVARFDFAMAAAGDEVDMTKINTITPEQVKHVYSSDLCEALVLWAWSRQPEHIVWDDQVQERIVELAVETGARYVSDPPLVQVENVRMKLARISVAIAARLFSTDETGEMVIVREQHAEAAVEFLDMVYGTEAMGYLRHSRRLLSAQKKAKACKLDMVAYLKSEISNGSLLHGLQAIGDGPFKARDFEELAGMDRIEAQLAVRQMLNWKMVRRMSRGALRMEPALIEILRMFEEDDDE